MPGDSFVDWLRLDPQASKEMETAKTFTCTECECSFDSLNSLCRHIRIHNVRCNRPTPIDEYSGRLSGTTYVCTVCDAQFQSKSDFDNHCLENAEAHECVECARRIKNALYLRIHRLIHRPSVLQTYKPKAVQLLLSGTGELEKIVLCNEKKPVKNVEDARAVDNFSLICHVYAKQFIHHRDLGRHLLTHGGKKRFECARCGLCFLLRHSLQRHMRAVHSMQRPHLCNWCGRSFAEKHQLSSHLKVHARSANPE